MSSLKLVIVLATIVLATSYAKEETSKGRDKRQQISYHGRRGGARPPPYAVQMEPIVQYSQRDPLYNPLINSKSDDTGVYEENPLSYYPSEPEPIIEIIIKESNESLPTPVPPPAPQTPRPTKEPIQVYYVKYEKKAGYGEKSRVVYDPPVRALTPVEEHEEIKPSHRQEEPPQPVTPLPSEPTTTLRAIIRPESETYHSGGSGIRVTFGTEQLPPNNHNKRSDIEKTEPTQGSKPHPIASVAPGAPKRQHGPYQPLQPVQQRVPPAFPQQRVVNSFQQPISLIPQQPIPQQPPQVQQQQQVPLKFLPQRQQQFPPGIPPRNPLQRPQQGPVPIQPLPDLPQRAPSTPFGTPHRISINHPQQPGLPPTLSVSHQSVHLQNQPLGPIQSNFERKPPQQPQPAQPPVFSQQEQEKQRYHEQRRQQEALKQREHQRQRDQQRLQEHRRLVELQRQFDQQRQIDQQRQADQHRHVEQQRQVEQHRQVEQQRLANQQRLVDQQQLAEQQRYVDQQRLAEEQRLAEQQRLIADQQRLQERQRQQEQHHLHEQRRRKQEQEQRLLQEQQYRNSLKYNQGIPSQGGIPSQPQLPIQKPEGEIFKAVPKLEQHYAIRENPLHPGPFPPNPVQASSFPESSLSQFQSQQLNPLQDSRQLSGGQSNRAANNEVPRQIQQQSSESHQIRANQRHPTFSPDSLQQHQQQQHQQQLAQYHQQQHWQHEQQAFWRRFPSQDSIHNGNNNNNENNNNNNGIQKSQTIYATPVSVSSEFGSQTGSKTSFRNTVPFATTSTTSTTTTTTTTTEIPTTTTTLSPKNEAKIKENIANLPDEVPDDIREQLLSSGILGNADIQILDYDKVGGIPIEKLPPEALANFYGAGGASAVAASEPVPLILKRPEPSLSDEEDSASSGSSSSGVVASISKDELPDTESTIMGSSAKFEQATMRPGGVEMKVVRFDPSTEQGRAVAEQHIRTDATHLEPVTVGPKNLEQYNRYLPLKVSGASFPIPNVPELEGRKITSVVVLAPVDYRFQNKEKGLETRKDRKLDNGDDDVQAVRFLNGETLKQLVKKPSEDNYKKWLEQESRTEPQKQSVVLLITTPTKEQPDNDKEIFMYDVNSKSVSKMAGDLSSAFVDAAESNSDTTDSFDDFSTY